MQNDGKKWRTTVPDKGFVFHVRVSYSNDGKTYFLAAPAEPVGMPRTAVGALYALYIVQSQTHGCRGEDDEALFLVFEAFNTLYLSFPSIDT